MTTKLLFFLISILILPNTIYTIPKKSSACNLFSIGEEYLRIGEEEEAIKYFKKAAEKNLLDAQFQLSAMLYKGIGCEKNIKEALKFCKIAAKRGHKGAKKMLIDIIAIAIIEILESLEKPIDLDIGKLLGLVGEKQDTEEANGDKEDQCAAKKISNRNPPDGMYI